jgi:UDP-glucuronate 4-epimerase
MPKVCLTGAAGFIGYHLSRRLLSLDWSVTGVDNLNDYYEVKLKEDRLSGLVKHPKFAFQHLDICDQPRLQQIYSAGHFDYTVHMAAQAGVRYSLENPHAYAQSNLVGFLNILECCRLFGTKHLVYASSSSVYGFNSKIPFSVRDNVDHPASLYAATKRAGELMAHVYSHLYGLPTTGLRFFTVYGPWGRPDMAPFLFTKAIIQGTPIKLFNNGNLKRDFTFIDDIVDGVVPMIERLPTPEAKHHLVSRPDQSWAPFRLYNIGNHQPVDLLHFLDLIERYTGCKAVRMSVPMQPGDVPITFADTAELTESIGFIPHTSVEDGLRKFIAWYRAYYRV